MDNWEYQNTQPEGYYNQYRTPEQVPNRFYNAALILGVISIASSCTVILPPILGALGILFVILGTRRGQKLPQPAKAGLVTSIIGLAGGIILYIIVLVTSVNMLKPENRDTFNKQFEQIYGIDFDSYMEDFMENYP